MTLSDISSIVGVISGLAVLGSLIYLAMQVRQTERNQRASVNQKISDRGLEITFQLAEQPLADLHLRAMTSREDFTETEILQLMNVAVAIATHAMDAWLQRKANLIDETAFATALRPVTTMFSRPVYRAIWPMSRSAFTREFREFFENHISSIALREQISLRDQFQINLKNVSRALQPMINQSDFH